MKTTVHIADALLAQAREVASRERTTVRALIEEGLRRLLDERESKRKFRLRKASFGGHGLNAELAAASWESVRALVYEGRGS